MIEISKVPHYSLVDHFGDGSTRSRVLYARVDGLWEQGSDTGDHYVLPYDARGDLIVVDNDGEIGRAAAMLPSSSPADCFSS